METYVQATLIMQNSRRQLEVFIQKRYSLFNCFLCTDEGGSQTHYQVNYLLSAEKTVFQTTNPKTADGNNDFSKKKLSFA